MRTLNFLKRPSILLVFSLGTVAAHGRIDRSVAQAYFDQAWDLSAAEGGLHWGRPLYGSMIFADPITQTHVANEKEPTSKAPRRWDTQMPQLNGAVFAGQQSFGRLVIVC
jgi:hypothetical protein